MDSRAVALPASNEKHRHGITEPLSPEMLTLPWASTGHLYLPPRLYPQGVFFFFPPATVMTTYQGPRASNLVLVVGSQINNLIPM